MEKCKHFFLMATPIMGAFLYLGGCLNQEGSNTTPSAVYSEYWGGDNVNNTPRFAYVTNQRDHSISIYAVTDPNNGKLRHNGYVTVPGQPIMAVIHPNTFYLYVPNFCTASSPAPCAGALNYISVFQINEVTGTLQWLQDFDLTPAPYSGAIPVWATFDRSGQYLYAANLSNSTISIMNVAAATGLISAHSSPTKSITNSSSAPVSMVVWQNGVSTNQFLYVANFWDDSITSYPINADGSLGAEKRWPLALNSYPYDITLMNPSTFIDTLYVAKYGDGVGNGAVRAYSIETVTSEGDLTLLNEEPAAVGTAHVIATSEGQYAYAVNFISDKITGYCLTDGLGSIPGYCPSSTTCPSADLGKKGGLCPMGSFLNDTLPAGSAPIGITVDPDLTSKFVYVTADGSTGAGKTPTYEIWGYPIITGPDQGKLATPHRIRTRFAPQGIVGFKAAAIPQYKPQHLFTADTVSSPPPSANKVSRFIVDTSGTTTDGCLGSLVHTPNSSANSSISIATLSIPGGSNYVYVSNGASGPAAGISRYINSGGTLASPLQYGTGPKPFWLTLDPSGSFLYLTDYPSGDNRVRAYSISKTTGDVTAMGTDQQAVQPRRLAVDPTGRFLHVANSLADSDTFYKILGYSIKNDGSLAPLSPPDNHETNFASYDVEFHPSGRYVYVSFPSNAIIASYSVSADKGILTRLDAVNTTPLGPGALTVDPTGSYLYVAHNDGLGNVSQYWIQDGTIGGCSAPIGALCPMTPTTSFDVNGGTGATLVDIVSDPAGKYVYIVEQSQQQAVYIYKISTTGPLTSHNGCASNPALLGGSASPSSAAISSTIQ